VFHAGRQQCGRGWRSAFAACTAALLGVGAAHGQATTDQTGPTAAEIGIRLQGPGVTISNAQFAAANNSDDPAMYGLFSNGIAGAGLQIDRGVVFSTGTVAEAFSTNNQNGASQGVGTTFSDPDLTALDANATRNVALVTMDVTLGPFVTGLEMRYQFGSDEYPDYVGSAFNDLFAVLISGPGITGTENIARLPSGAVTDVANVNIGTRGCQGATGPFGALDTASFIRNGHSATVDGATGRLVCNTNPGPFPVVVEWNGLTTALTALRTGLTSGQTYQIKIAVADTGDASFDSGAVFEVVSATYDVDHADGPASYGAATHTITSNLRLGTLISGESAGFNSATATGDNDDALIMPVLQAGVTETLDVRVTGAGGLLQAWFDWNDDGDFNDSGEQVATNLQDDNADGYVQVAVTPPSNASTVNTIARFRWSSTASLGPSGAAGSGEVEDYAVTINGTSTVYTCPAGYSVIAKTGNAASVVTAAENSTLALGAILAAGSTTNNTNSARVTGTAGQTVLTLRLGDIVPAGAPLIFSLARDTSTSSMAVDTSPDGVTFTQRITFNTGTVDRTQRVTLTTPSGGVEYVRFRRTASNTWIDGVQYDFACLGQSELQGSKTTALYDPASSGLLAIPGNDVTYTITVANAGATATDTDSVVIIDAMPQEVTFFNGATAEFGGNVVGFSQTGTGLTFNPASDVRYSNSPSRPANFAACTYTPSAGYDPNVTYICINPKGSMAAGNPDPQFSVSFRARIK
jgi:uncharacterized repeat protein (TIGR01451 family)